MAMRMPSSVMGIGPRLATVVPVRTKKMFSRPQKTNNARNTRTEAANRPTLMRPAAAITPANTTASSNCQNEPMANAENMSANADSMPTRGSRRSNRVRRSPTVAVSEPAASTDDSVSGSASQVAFTVDSVDSLESARFAGLPNMMVRSASSSTSSCECEMSSMVTPRDLSSWMSPCTRAAASSSRPAVGSSRINAFGSHAITPAIATSRCWPPDRSNGKRSRRCSICSSRMACMARSIASDVSNPRLEGPYATSSATVSANSCRSGCCMT